MLHFGDPSTKINYVDSAAVLVLAQDDTVRTEREQYCHIERENQPKGDWRVKISLRCTVCFFHCKKIDNWFISVIPPRKSARLVQLPRRFLVGMTDVFSPQNR